mmetsp:Transcript_23450/g.92933  ORF Transcript_23450/g.92933 Transcript_23450/m.92933 type:complete len:426 (+) Transcript_23450:196-1473(+)|eukprot:CAMPEP_0185702892 /NCGR_PEP_ID=MMETSP1164-20130828/13144_1 /TAXON_ID=1104430 /ORGANISM="Chrysoreinhardia sp, Strain CCMP2950" /LENGTH=425 /DNA_ID=CAMNT_0028370147 /DNA_START=133 /DNA_END=1410 /DNA_ORIENTATION=-
MPLRSRRKKDKAAHSRMPIDTDLRQQRLAAWTPVFTPLKLISSFGIVGGVFLTVGLVLKGRADEAVQAREQYDGDGTASKYSACKISRADEARRCNVTVEVDRKMRAPVQVFYEISNFYQNHRRYVKSLNWEQIHNREVFKQGGLKASDCELLYKNGSRALNPCGLTPNTLFNDVIALAEPSDVTMKEDDIAWRSDVKDVLKRPDDFTWGRAIDRAAVDAVDDVCFDPLAYVANVNCEPATCALFDLPSRHHGDCYGYVCGGRYREAGRCDQGERIVFHYDRTDKWQYLYHTFPQTVSPIVGNDDEHFAVWMRHAALPRFRKLYGRITETLEKDTRLVFEVESNFDVSAFDGTKAIVVATDGGFEIDFLANCYIALAAFCLFFAVFFAVVQAYFRPRHMGDPAFVPWLDNDDDMAAAGHDGGAGP